MDAGGGPTAIGIASIGVDVSVANSHFTNNQTIDMGVTNGAYGSAVGVTTANLSVHGSDFTGNSATSDLTQTQGSAIYHSTGQIAVSDSTFTGNIGANIAKAANPSGSLGGAVSLWGVGGNITHSTFTGNKTTVANTGNVSYGGALYARSGVWGGEKDLKLTVSSSVFKLNEAQGDAAALGGAIYVKADPNTVDGPYMFALDVDKSLFEGNRAAGSGGAIYSLNAPVSVSGSQFIDNEVSRQGGAIMIKNTSGNIAASSIRDSSFTGNRVTGEWGVGAAVAVSAVTLDIGNSSFSQNKSDMGSALTVLLRNEEQKNANVNRSEVNVADSVFSGNEARTGGAIASFEGLGITSSTFTGNKVQDDTDGGGAIFLGAESKTVIANSTFTGNESNTSGGGAIDTRKGDVANNSGAALDIRDSVFSANSANEHGGAIRNSFYNSQDVPDAVNVAKSRFDGNTAGQKGGAIYNDVLKDKTGKNISLAIADSEFNGNHAGVAGGALYNSEGATTTFTGINIFSSNTVGNNSNIVKNDIHNEGTIDIASGTTILDGGISGITGIVNVNGGELRTNVSRETGTVNVSGGMLVASEIGQEAKIVLSSGALKTTSNQVMENGLNEDGRNIETGDKLDVVTYKGGTLALTDAKYNLEYAKAVGNKINDAGQKTIVEMTGTLVDSGTGQKISEVNVSDLPTGSVVLTDVTGKTEGKELVVGSSSSEGKVAVDGSLGVSSLNLGMAGSVTVTGGQSLTLAGNNGELVQSIGTDGRQQAVVLNVDANASSLNLGSATTGKNGQLTGTIIAGEGTTINVSGGIQKVTGSDSESGITTSGTVNVAGGAGLNASLDVKDGGKVSIAQGGVLQSGKLDLNGTLAVGGAATVDSLNASEKSSITVGNNQSQGYLNVANAKLNGAMVFLDPAWLDGSEIGNASQAVLKFSGDAIDGRLVAGQNSMLVLGDISSDWAKAEFEKTGRKWGNGTGEITAALAVRSPMTLDSGKGSIWVNGALETAPVDEKTNQARFADNSMLIVDVSRLTDKAAISSTGGIATVAGTAALHVANAKVGSDVAILDGFTGGSGGVDISTGGWSGDNLTTTDAMIKKLALQNENGNVSVQVEANRAEEMFPGVLPANTMNRIWAADGVGVNGDGKGVNDTESSNAGIAFLSRAADESYVSRGDATRTINGASLIAVAAGVQSSTIQASDAVNRALQDHLSLTSNIGQKGAPSLHKTGADLWVNLLYQNSDSGGIRAGSFNADHENSFGGIIFGSDYTWKDVGDGSFRVGGALNFGTGDGKSRGDFNHTKNDYDSYGVSLYGGWNNSNTNVVVDVGYLKVDNELKQNGSFALGGDLKADVDTKVWTVGVKGEYQFKTDALDITPHAGIRYLNVKTNSFDTRNNMGTVFHTNSDSLNLWQIPVGVTLSRDYVASSGWTVKPKFDISIIPTAGDRNAKTTVGVPGVGTSDSISSEVMDSTSWNATLGLDMQKGNTSFGVKVGYQKSDDAKSRGAMLNVNHQFD